MQIPYLSRSRNLKSYYFIFGGYKNVIRINSYEHRMYGD